MASKVWAGGAGWGVAGLLALALLGQCLKGPSTSTPAGATGALGVANIEPEQVAASWRYVQPASANCRVDHTTSAEVQRSLSRNDFVGVIRQETGWSLVKGAPNCWVRSDLLGETRNVAPPRSTPQRTYSGGSDPGRSTPRRRSEYQSDAGSCPCRGNRVCIGPRGGRYCITSGGNKRYGV
jgi:hypothetical protein